MTARLAARRLLLSAGGLELLRRRVLVPPLTLPPGFEPAPAAVREGHVLDELLRCGAARSAQPGEWEVHPSVGGDLHVLAVPEVAVGVRATRPGLDVTACVAVSGPRGAGLLRTDDAAVQLSAFPAEDLAGELARAVPAPQPGAAPPAPEEVALDALLHGSGSRLRGRVCGTLRATVLRGPAAGRPGDVVGSVQWVWDGAGWVGLEPLPSRGGRPWVRLVPVVPADLHPWTSGLVAAALR